MQILKYLPLALVGLLCAQATFSRAAETEAQRKAREAMRQKMEELDPNAGKGVDATATTPGAASPSPITPAATEVAPAAPVTPAPVPVQPESKPAPVAETVAPPPAPAVPAPAGGPSDQAYAARSSISPPNPPGG